MKNSHLLLSLVSFSLTLAGARAASSENNIECLHLPAYTVEAPRQSAAEKQIAQNLEELRATARTPLPFRVEIPLLKTGDKSAHGPAKPVLVVAKS
jgi:hypothetical protein